ncbi:hypothetical protein D3C71_1648110 [compost metagenome]
MPSARSLPEAMWARDAVTVSMTSGICPPSTSVIDCPEALYLTANSGACACCTNCANTTWAVVLGRPTLRVSGLDLARAIRSPMPLVLRSDCVVLMTMGSRPIIATDSKSRAGLKPRPV